MAKRDIRNTEYTCNACGFSITVETGQSPTSRDATGTIDFRYGNRHHPFESWWLCHDCMAILEKFLSGDLTLNAETKHLALLDERLNDWWLGWCRMESALKSLGHDVEIIKDGTSTLSLAQDSGKKT